jgi:hypothetical protein
VLLEKGGRFFFYEPGSALLVSDGSITTAYEKFLAARRDYFEEVERAGLTIGWPSLAGRNSGQAQVHAGRTFGGELGLFVSKFCIVLLIVVGIGASVVTSFVNGLQPLVGQMKQAIVDLSASGGLSMVDIANKAEVIVKDVGAMPQERKDSLKRSIGILSREIEPMIDAWRNPPSTPAPATSPAR